MERKKSRRWKHAILLICAAAAAVFLYARAHRCGNTLFWSYNSLSKTMTVFGWGDTWDRLWDYNESTGRIERMFKGKDIQTIAIRNGMTKTGMLFTGIETLQTVKIPRSVISIDENAFDGCTSLKEIIVDPRNTAYTGTDGVLFLKDSETLVKYPAAKTDTFYCVPDGIRRIGNFAFEGCSFLTAIKLPDSVTSIGELAFAGSKVLTSFVIPDGVSDIEYGTFSGCIALESVILPDGLKTISRDAFNRCYNLISLRIPDSVSFIGDGALTMCGGLDESTISSGNLSYALVDGVLFTRDMQELLQYPSSKTDSSYTVPDGVTRIGEGAFSGCSALTTVVFPDSLEQIGYYAFESCANLESPEFPDGIKEIDNYAFYNCNEMTTVTIPRGAEYIGTDAFATRWGQMTVRYEGTKEEWAAIAGCLNDRAICSDGIYEYEYQ